MSLVRTAVPTLAAIAAVALVVMAGPTFTDRAQVETAGPTPYSADHGRIQDNNTAEPAPTF